MGYDYNLYIDRYVVYSIYIYTYVLATLYTNFTLSHTTNKTLLRLTRVSTDLNQSQHYR